MFVRYVKPVTLTVTVDFDIRISPTNPKKKSTTHSIRSSAFAIRHW